MSPRSVRTIGLHEQRMWMMQYHPQIRCSIQKRRAKAVLVCRGTVRPTPCNASYHVRIEYRTRKRPRIWVDEPILRRRTQDETIPHTFADDEPCLFFDDFSSDMRIACTVMPWLCLWLVFYECWLVTGEWQGGGMHPQPPSMLADEEGV